MKILLLIIALLFIGCDDKINTRVELNDNGITEIGENVYIKGVRVRYNTDAYHIVYVYCTKNGTVIPSTPITTKYTSGKNSVTTATLP